MKRIMPVQGLTIIFIIGLMTLTIIFHSRIPLWRSLVLFYFMLLAFIFILRYSIDKKICGKLSEFLFNFSPIVFVILTYESLGSLIPHLRSDIDHLLIKIDFYIFGQHPTLWMERFITPWFTDIMSLAYLSYYFIPVILISVLYLKDKTVEFNHAMFVLAFGYYLSFIGYILFPAIGPRFTLEHLYSIHLKGSFITDFVRDTLNALEHNKRDCMPSGHTQIVLMVLYLASRYERLLFSIFLPIVCLLIISTVYLRYHYVIDLFAGFLFAVISILVSNHIYKKWVK